VIGGGSEMVLSFRVAPGLRFRGKWLARITEGESDDFYEVTTQKGRLSLAPICSPTPGMGRGMLFATWWAEVGFGPTWAVWAQLQPRRKICLVWGLQPLGPPSEKNNPRGARQDSATFRISLPKFSPVNSLTSAWGKFCRPSTTSSRDLSLPAAIQPAISRAACG
jgi:hypothetical protein